MTLAISSLFFSGRIRAGSYSASREIRPSRTRIFLLSLPPPPPLQTGWSRLLFISMKTKHWVEHASLCATVDARHWATSLGLRSFYLQQKVSTLRIGWTWTFSPLLLSTGGKGFTLIACYTTHGRVYKRCNGSSCCIYHWCQPGSGSWIRQTNLFSTLSAPVFWLLLVVNHQEQTNCKHLQRETAISKLSKWTLQKTKTLHPHSSRRRKFWETEDWIFSSTMQQSIRKLIRVFLKRRQENGCSPTLTPTSLVSNGRWGRPNFCFILVSVIIGSFDLHLVIF